MPKNPIRKPLVAANWKMNTERAEAAALAKNVVDSIGRQYKVDVVLCPPYIWLHDVGMIIRDSNISLGAQNMHWEDKGAFTGEISSIMLKSIGCKYVIIGHSERRQLFGETDENVNKKLKKALTVVLMPIICLGETLEERESNRTAEIVTNQFRSAFDGISDFGGITIAYEPVWAIGTGRNATPQQAQEVHKILRQMLQNKTAEYENIRILYGGSVKPDNAAELYKQDDIDGFLVGGASLKAGDFAAIVQAAMI
ncbi:MAG: triose-phosphate isomerase [candidate division Zixibacteria bacterium]|nr:triose-phosphate isomerase [candidate division Zixibacteria bacterium]